MYSKEHLLKDLQQLKIQNGISQIYGRGGVIELNLQPKYKLIVAESNISPKYSCFWGVTKNVVDNLSKDKEDFALVLMDTRNNQVYVYDKKEAKKLLSRVSFEKVYGNYRITENDVENPISYNTFYEFLETL